jgi:hypothetical protein
LLTGRGCGHTNESAEEIYRLAVGLKGLLIKVGQFAGNAFGH